MNDILKKIQKETGLRMGNFPNEQNRIFNMCQLSILMLESIWKDINTNKLQNSQMCLDWLDKINEISIRN